MFLCKCIKHSSAKIDEDNNYNPYEGSLSDTLKKKMSLSKIKSTKNLNSDSSHLDLEQILLDFDKINREYNYKHLICDDASTNRLVLEKYLVKFGAQVDQSKNGEEAIEMTTKNGVYNIIWMDIKMPKMNGIDTTDFLRKKLNYSGVIIGLTGYVDEVTKEKCLSAGMNIVLSKPFDKDLVKHYTEIYAVIPTTTKVDTTQIECS